MEHDSLFAGTVAGRVMLESGCRAVQSMPLIDGSGVLLGMLSTHFSLPRAPSGSELAMLGEVAAEMAKSLKSGGLAAG